MKMLKIMMVSLFVSVGLIQSADAGLGHGLAQLSLGAAAASSPAFPDVKKLPFEYRVLTEEEKAHSVFVPQGHHAILRGPLDDGSTIECYIQSAVVGPLHPCVMLAVKDTDLNETVVFHIPVDNYDIDYIYKVLEHAFAFGEELDGSDWQVVIFTKRYKASNGSRSDDGKYFSLQEELLKKLSDFVSEKGCKNMQIITAPVESDFEGDDCLDYHAADRELFVTFDLKVFSLSMYGQSLLTKVLRSKDRFEQEQNTLGGRIAGSLFLYKMLGFERLEGIASSEKGFARIRDLEVVFK